MPPETWEQLLGVTADDYASFGVPPPIRPIGASRRLRDDGSVEFYFPDPDANQKFVDFALKTLQAHRNSGPR